MCDKLLRCRKWLPGGMLKRIWPEKLRVNGRAHQPWYVCSTRHPKRPLVANGRVKSLGHILHIWHICSPVRFGYPGYPSLMKSQVASLTSLQVLAPWWLSRCFGRTPGLFDLPEKNMVEQWNISENTSFCRFFGWLMFYCCILHMETAGIHWNPSFYPSFLDFQSWSLHRFSSLTKFIFGQESFHAYHAKGRAGIEHMLKRARKLGVDKMMLLVNQAGTRMQEMCSSTMLLFYCTILRDRFWLEFGWGQKIRDGLVKYYCGSPGFHASE